MEDRNTVTRLLQSNNFMAKLDLKDAYFLIPIHPDDKKVSPFLFFGATLSV